MAKEDIGLFLDEDDIYDIAFGEDGDFVESLGMTTALLFSLFAERRADASEVLNPYYRRGWMGNVDAETPGYEDGSKLWLYIDQARLTSATISGIRLSGQEGLKWLVLDDLALSVSAKPTFTDTSVDMNVVIVVAGGVTENYLFNLWRRTI